MKFNIENIPKFVINLNGRPDRLEETKKEFNYMNWSFERFDAIDTGDYKGCGYSHKKIAEIIIERNYDYTMICEDDIFFMPYTKQLKSKINELLNETEWDFFNLAPSLHRPVKKYNEEFIDLTNLPPKDEKIHRGIYSTACFIITKKVAEIIIKWDTDEILENKCLHMPIDMYFDLAIYPKFKSLSYKLPLATQRPGFSNINHTNDSNHYLITYNWNVYSPDKITPKYFDYNTCVRERNII